MNVSLGAGPTFTPTPAPSPELQFLSAVPLRLSLAIGFLAYGFSKPSLAWKIVGGGILGSMAIEYFIARRQAELEATFKPQALSGGVEYFRPGEVPR